jgi:hypothetical protein
VIYDNTRIQIPEQRTIGKERIKRKEEPRNIQKNLLLWCKYSCNTRLCLKLCYILQKYYDNLVLFQSSQIENWHEQGGASTWRCLALTYGLSPAGTLWTTWNRSFFSPPPPPLLFEKAMAEHYEAWTKPRQ